MGQDHLTDLIERRLDRRSFLAGSLGATAGLMMGGRRGLAIKRQGAALKFVEVPGGRDGHHHVPTGYKSDVLIRWGDPLDPTGPAFSPTNLSAAIRKTQFGDYNDFIGYFPLGHGEVASRHGLLCVNHEFSRPDYMFPGFTTRKDLVRLTKSHAACELASQGVSVIEVELKDNTWGRVPKSRFARRITGLDTPVDISGPAAGSPRMRTGYDPTGRRVLGTFANCAGGMTPWGTLLSCEENFQVYFVGSTKDHPEPENLARYEVTGRLGAAGYWGMFIDRLNLVREPLEFNRYGWVVEVDPYDPTARPIKRTALGRFRHEGASSVVNRDGRVVVYLGDDAPGEYLYRFVSAHTVHPVDRKRNLHLLDEGVLSVARFDDEGTLRWMPLVFGSGPLNEKNGFKSQADVLIETRRAADLLGATSMDRPEGVEANPVSQRVFVMLTNNVGRGKTNPLNAANPRTNNIHGHVLELIPPGGNHAAESYKWDIFLRGGDPKSKTDDADYQGSLVTDSGWISCPDNCTFDRRGRLWIATDGHRGGADGLFACETSGPRRALTRRFFRAPAGAEVCGPRFTPDNTTLFLSIQHPGMGPGAHFSQPTCRWPDQGSDGPARSAVLAIRREDGGVIGD